MQLMPDIKIACFITKICRAYRFRNIVVLSVCLPVLYIRGSGLLLRRKEAVA
ncbi:hypothetical protein D3C72_544600 [compost metagenome]